MLLDSTQTLIQAGVSERLLSVLEDIVHKVEVSADFSISHPDYKPLELPVEAASCPFSETQSANAAKISDSAIKERVQMLYWLKSQAIATRQELSQRLG